MEPMANMAQYENVAGRIHSIESFGGVDGPGVRFVVFFQGCPLRCLYCHNPDSWAFGEGKEITAGALAQEISAYKNYLRRGGVTLSGGEPLAQPAFARAVLSLCKRQGLHTALDTAGALPLSTTEACIRTADLLLLDIKALDSGEARQLTGMENNHTLETLRFCEEIGKPVWIRHVCVPGYTLDAGKLTQLAAFLKPFSCVECIELIRFHQMGRHKWASVDVPYRLDAVESPSVDEMEQAKQIFRDRGFQVR